MVITRILLLAVAGILAFNRYRGVGSGERVVAKELRYYFIAFFATLVTILCSTYAIRPTLFSAGVISSPRYFLWIGNLILALGIALWMWSNAALGINWSGRIAIRNGHTLITSGPYTWIRHPMYLSYLIQFIGLSLATSNVALIIPYGIGTILALSRIGQEENVLINNFPDQYPQYTLTTWRLLPGIF